MSFPYHRGHPNTGEMTQRGTGNWGTREQRVEEGNRTLMEEENDRKWVRLLERADFHEFSASPAFKNAFFKLI